MAFPTKDTFAFDHEAQSDYPGWTPAVGKENFNKRSEEMRVALNAVVALLNSVIDGASGADNTAMTPISSIGSQSSVQSIIEALTAILKSTAAGSSGAKFVGVETIAGLTGNDVQTLLTALKTLADGYNTSQSSALGIVDSAHTTALNTHKGSSDHDGRYYTETELNAGQLNNLYFTETESDARFATHGEVQDVVLGQIPDRSLEAIKIALGTITTAELAFNPATQDELDGLAGDGRTTETVKGVNDALVGHQAETVQYRADKLYLDLRGCRYID